jgi:uncharacterized protein DUF397
MPGLNWLRAAGCDDGHCVEVATEYGYILVRNSDQPLEIIRFTADEWSAFTNGVVCGDFVAVDLGGPA